MVKNWCKNKEKKKRAVVPAQGDNSGVAAINTPVAVIKHFQEVFTLITLLIFLTYLLPLGSLCVWNDLYFIISIFW